MEERSLKEEEKSEGKDSRLRFLFPKSAKIRKKNDFKAFRISKNRFVGSFLVLDYRVNENITSPRFGIIISSKIGKSNVRNKLKRQALEIFRLNQHEFKKNIEILAILKKNAKNAKYQDLQRDVFKLISYLNKTNDLCKHEKKIS